MTSLEETEVHIYRLWEQPGWRTQPTNMNCHVTCVSLWLLKMVSSHSCVFTLSPTQVPLALFPPLPSPPVRLDISGTSLIIRLQWSAMLTGCPLVAVPLSRHRGSTAAAAAVCGGEVIIALPLSLQSQLVSVVLNVWLLLQSQVHLQREQVQDAMKHENTNRHPGAFFCSMWFNSALCEKGCEKIRGVAWKKRNGTVITVITGTTIVIFHAHYIVCLLSSFLQLNIVTLLFYVIVWR